MKNPALPNLGRTPTGYPRDLTSRPNAKGGIGPDVSAALAGATRNPAKSGVTTWPSGTIRPDRQETHG